MYLFGPEALQHQREELSSRGVEPTLQELTHFPKFRFLLQACVEAQLEEKKTQQRPSVSQRLSPKERKMPHLACPGHRQHALRPRRLLSMHFQLKILRRGKFPLRIS